MQLNEIQRQEIAIKVAKRLGIITPTIKITDKNYGEADLYKNEINIPRIVLTSQIRTIYLITHECLHSLIIGHDKDFKQKETQLLKELFDIAEVYEGRKPFPVKLRKGKSVIYL
jgi:predicted metal-dependent hydrolase